MKPQITDKIWLRLTKLSRHDVDDATAARIREHAVRVLKSRPPSQVAALARSVERIWSDFFELPLAGAVVVACLVWLFQGVASDHHSSDEVMLVDSAVASGFHRPETSALRKRRAARHTSTHR